MLQVCTSQKRSSWDLEPGDALHSSVSKSVTWFAVSSLHTQPFLSSVSTQSCIAVLLRSVSRIYMRFKPHQTTCNQGPQWGQLLGHREKSCWLRLWELVTVPCVVTAGWNSMALSDFILPFTALDNLVDIKVTVGGEFQNSKALIGSLPSICVWEFQSHADRWSFI